MGERLGVPDQSKAEPDPGAADRWAQESREVHKSEGSLELERTFPWEKKEGVGGEGTGEAKESTRDWIGNVRTTQEASDGIQNSGPDPLGQAATPGKKPE